MTQDHMKTVAVSAIAFDEAPSFCRNGMSFTNGKGFRFTSETCLSVPGQPDVTAAKGSVLFKDKDGLLSFHTSEEFEERFSRLLKNGCHVRLSRTDHTQLIEIRQAEDEKHLKDWIVWKGHDIADAGLSAYRTLVTSELFLDAAMMACDGKVGARELSADLRERAEKVWNAPENEPLRAQVGNGIAAFKQGLKKMAWGKFGNGD